MLTKNTIKTYLSSPEGKKMTELFSPTLQEWQDRVEKIAEMNQSNIKLQPKDLISLLPSVVVSIDDAEKSAGIEVVKGMKDFKKIIEDLILATWEDDPDNEDGIIGTPWHNQGDYRSISAYMPLISIAFWLLDKENGVFYPILYSSNFSDFKDICSNAGIELPDTPPQKDKKGRCLFYYGICEALDAFRRSNEISKAEICALLYGYLKDEIDEIKGVVKSGEELPAPMRIWWAGASKEDYGTSLHDDVSIWQGNEQCQRGDIVVIYARSPHSHIHSIWRAARDAKFEPFDYYCDRIIVSDRKEVPHISIQELKNDVRTKDWPVVHKQMQGMNQFEITPKQYEVLLDIFAEKGMDTTELPRLETPVLDDAPEIKIEKDVEERLLIPLLSELGYSDIKGEDWDRQFPIKLGHKVHGIPDFVFFPKSLETGGAFAPMLIEAKLDFKNVKQMKIDFTQGVSYVNPLGATYMGICDKHQIRIYKKPANGIWSTDMVPEFESTWTMLKNPEKFNKLKRLIGRDIIAKIKK